MFADTITKSVLENGLGITVKSIPFSRTISMGLFIDHGVKDESVELNGISHFIEHMAFNLNNMGYEAKKSLGNLLDTGALYEAFTSKEMTRCSITARNQYQDEIIETLSHIVSKPNLFEENVEHERAVILQEADTYFSSSRVKAELLEQALWGKRSLGLFVIGTKENIRKFNTHQLEQRFSSFYTPRNTQLIIQGNIDERAIVEKIAEYFGKWNTNNYKGEEILIQVEPSVIGVGKNERVDITIGFTGPSFHSKEKYSLLLLADILGRDIKSKLFLELREKRELVYAVYAYAMTYNLSGYLAINVNCKKKDIQEVYKLIQEILEEIKKNGVSEKELERAKALRVTHMLQLLNDTNKYMQLVGRHSLLNKDFFIDRERLEFENVTTRDIQNLSCEIFVNSRMGISAIGINSEDVLEII